MTNQQTNQTAMFRNLVEQFQQSALIFLGEIPNPQTGKISKNLAHAAYFLEMLQMIKAKTKGNLSAGEEKYLQETVHNLHLPMEKERGGFA